MNEKEFATLAMAIRTYYPKENILPNKESMKLWFRELQDIPFQVAEAALRKWVSTNKWSPSIAEIREMSANIQNGDIPDWSEGWEQVRKAIRNYGFYEPKKAMESLDPLTRKVVERIGFRELCLSNEDDKTNRANFRMVYETLQKREQTRQQLALPLQDTIKQLNIGFMMIGDGGEDL